MFLSFLETHRVILDDQIKCVCVALRHYYFPRLLNPTDQAVLTVVT